MFDYEIINLGESQTISLNDMIKAIENVTGMTAQIDPQPEQAGDVRVTYADITKARELLDYDPKYPLAKGLDAFWAWFCENREVLTGR